MKISTTLVLKIAGGIACITLLFLGGFYYGKGNGERAAEKAWKEERKLLLDKADSIESAAKVVIREAQDERSRSEERVGKLTKSIALLDYQDSLDEVHYKRDLRYYKSLINRPVAEIQDIMMKEYEAATDTVRNHN